MQRLLQILARFQVVLLFLILEGSALYLAFQSNQQRSFALGDFLLDTRGWVHQRVDGVVNLFSRKAQNERLIAENATLYQQLQEALQRQQLLETIIGVDSLRRIVLDSLQSEVCYDYLPGNIVENSVAGFRNTFIVDKGAEHGVKPGMGVMSSTGIAGKIVKVGPRFSLALSALNTSFRVAAQAIPSQDDESFVAIYRWDGGSPDRARLVFIPETVELTPGDPVVTAGNSTIFPRGVRIGEIARVEQKSEQGFVEAEITLATNFRALQQVYLLAPEHQTAIDSLRQLPIAE